MGCFLHDIHIVEAFAARQGISGVFQIPGHVLLLVQVVRPHAHALRGFPSHAHHLRRGFPRRQQRGRRGFLPLRGFSGPGQPRRGLLFSPGRGSLDGQGMHRQAFRRQPDRLLQGVGKFRDALPGQPGNQIHIDL